MVILILLAVIVLLLTCRAGARARILARTGVPRTHSSGVQRTVISGKIGRLPAGWWKHPEEYSKSWRAGVHGRPFC